MAGLNGSKEVTVNTNNQLVTTQKLNLNGKEIVSPIPGRNEQISSYNDNANSSLIYMGEDNYIRRNTFMIGGKTRNAYVGMKATCQTTGGGDLGGSCYQFTNMAGSESGHRSGAGETDSINMDMRTTNNDPIDVIGGNTFKIIGTFGCGLSYAQSRCEMSGVNILNDKNEEVTTIKVTPGSYDPSKNITLVKLPSSYKVNQSLTSGDNVNIKFYSSDGVAYAVDYTAGGVKIYPKLSIKESNLIHPRMALWTNIANGMQSTEGGTSEDAGNVDMPNYYYGYQSGSSTGSDYTSINVETYYYPGTGQDGGWRNLTNQSKKATVGIPGNIIDSVHKNDQYDYQITYKYPGTNELRYNSNYHRYSQPALFLGLTQKNFNLYALQYHTNAVDSVTREYDNEWDFWMPGDHDGQIVTRGLTMTWGGSGSKVFATGSYMLRLAGFNNMPLGLKIDGVFPIGGKILVTDAGFNINKWVNTRSDLLKNTNDIMTIGGLGQAKTNGHAYQLFSYMSNDGNVDKKKNNSLHLDMTQQNSTAADHSLAGNQSPTCNNSGGCSVLGQIIFDPLDYIGGVALGSGQGENTKLGLIVDKDNNVTVNNKLIVNGKPVNDVVNNALVKSQVNAANGVAGLNANKEVTANINTHYLRLLNPGNVLRFYIGDSNIHNFQVDMFFNPIVSGARDGLNNLLDENTFYFTNLWWGNKYKFNGDVAVTGRSTADNFTAISRVITPNLRLTLSTPTSSSAACTAGDIKDDANYHYVCVAANKWKRVALSDF